MFNRPFLAQSLLRLFLGSGGTMKKTSLLHKISFVCSVVIISWGMAQCGATTGGAAAPQSSIPLPDAQDPITVSAPDADGIVRVTGSAGAVPNNAVVVVEVGVATTSSLGAELCVAKVDEIFKTECTSALPACPSLDSDNKCQDTAADDGSFTLQVPAGVDDNILVSYLDPDTCAETTAYTVVVTENVRSVPMDVADVFYIEDTDTLIFFGSTEDDDAALIAYNLSDSSSFDNSLDPIAGVPLSIDYFEDMSAVEYALVTTSEGISIANEVQYDTAAVSGFHEVYDGGGYPLSNGQYLDAYLTSYGSSVGETKVNQVFFYQNDSFQIIEFGDDIDDLGLGTITSDGRIQAQTLPAHFTIIEDSFDGFTSEDITTFSYFRFLGDEIVLVLGFEYAAETWYVVLKRAYSYREAAGDSLDFTAADTDMIVLGSTAGGVFVDLVEGYSSEQEPYALTVLKIVEQDVSVIILEADTLSCFDDSVISLADYEGDDENNECVTSGGEDEMQVAADDVDTSGVLVTDVLIDADHYGELFVVGGSNLGSRFITQHGTTSLFETDDTVNVITPIFAGYYLTGNAMIVVDVGNTDDNVSNIVFYELAATPTLD